MWLLETKICDRLIWQSENETTEGKARYCDDNVYDPSLRCHSYPRTYRVSDDKELLRMYPLQTFEVGSICFVDVIKTWYFAMT